MFDKGILEKLRKELGFRDRGIFDKTVYAINLLCDLTGFYPKLIFKGGTSLLLHKFPPARFSIDIDILLNESERDSLMENLQALVALSGVFKSVEEDERESGGIHKAHYKFFYDSYLTSIDQYILLDVVFCERHPYHAVVSKNLRECPLVLAETDVIVQTPSAEGLLADKMSAISPGTIGIPLLGQDAKKMEFVKQVIDIGVLFDLVENLDDIRKSFAGIVAQENKFRSGTHKPEEVLDDIVDVAFKYSQSHLRGANNSHEEIGGINNGFVRLSNHLVARLTKRTLKIAFAKIVYMCKLLREDTPMEIIKDIDDKVIERKQFIGDYRILDRLKRINPQAYSFWILGYGHQMAE